MKIDGVNGNGTAEQLKGTTKGGSSFVDTLKDSIKKVGELEKEADKEVEKLAKMESDDVTSTMMAIEKADLTFQLMMQVRNKILDAYQEIMRMTV
ncbi:MAG TPA: flagellar hook-basal body complex protein FliE [Syntrophorhabdales bacterium]|jgi:flagellar hook-basal body complex protein FliE|nr:flagellar hook-basal body complex protein FliE [Syntrophorhabdales bacterium]